LTGEKAQEELARLAVDSLKVDSQAAMQAKDLSDYLRGLKDTDANGASRIELQMITDSSDQPGKEGRARCVSRLSDRGEG
jgi:hypothetical protein